jgi:TolB protein
MKLSLILGILGLIIIFLGITRIVQNRTEVYRSTRYPITLEYPAAWKPIDGYEERIGKKNAFFQVGALANNGATIDDVTLNEAFNKLKPYGSQPTIENLTVDKQEARRIRPSGDQPREMQGQTAVIIRSPRPFRIEETEYAFIILWTDSNHIDKILPTVIFNL